MDPINDARFYESLIKLPHLRSPQDVRNIYDQLRQLDMFNTLYNAPLKAICASARFERHPPQHVLFREGQVATCWYILLSGSVFIDNHIYLPYGCFGKRNGINYRRVANCIVLQESEMIVIDYPDVQRISVGPTVTATTKGVLSQSPHHTPERAPNGALKRYTASSHPSLDGGMPPPVPPRPDRFHNSSSSSISSSTAPPVPSRGVPRGLPRSYPVDFPVDVPSTSFTTVASIAGENHRSQVFVNGVSSSPAHSSSSSSIPHSQSTSERMDRMERDDNDEATLVRVKHRREKSNSIGGSSHSTAANRAMRVRSTASSSTTEDAPSSSHGLADSEDEDEESCPSHDSFMELKDSVRECLEKEPGLRNSDDLAVLLDFMQHMAAFASLPVSIKRQLCLKMVFAVVNEAGTIVMHHGEKLDAWSVIVNGQVEVVRPTGERVEYKLGDAFGCDPSPTQQIHQGDMRTLVDDCEFVLVEHKDFCSIMSTLSEHIEKDRDGLTGEIVSETERRTVGNQVGLVLIKGKPDKLMAHLVDERDASIDPHYIDDFLLTYRVFIHNPCTIFEKLMYWFAEPNYRDKVARIVLLWVNNHHNDFETNDEMNKLLTRFEGALERDGMHSQQSLLNIACSVKARPREITMSRANKDDSLPFVLVGGKELNTGIFVSHVDVDSSGEKMGMRRGDELLEVNGLALKYVTLARANELAKGSLQVRLLLKSNILGFKELIARNSPEVMSSSSAAKQRTKALVGALGQPRGSMPNVKAAPPLTGGTPSKMMTMKNGGVMDKLFTMLKSTRLEGSEETDERQSSSNELRSTRSNPDLANTISQYYGPVRSDSPEHVLKIYRADQTFKYLPVYKETTAQNVVQLALQEFGMTSEGSLEWSLCETSVTPERVIKQRRLPPQMENLAERIALNGRYYLKNNTRSDTLVPDDLAPELLKEAQSHLLNLNAHVVACQLTLQDFASFSSIEPTEYVDNLFQLESRYGWARLSEFERLFNQEMWWVGSEICAEKNVGKRAKLIKKFIKVARYCRDLRNFNSMFAIMSGLDKPAVRRLHASWDRVGSKYIRWLEEVHTLVDPSRNMSRYRQHLATVSHDPPVIPIYPVLKKDLTFMHEGNPTYTEKLVNFEKLRLIARAIRAVGKLSSAPYEIGAMAERSGGTLNDALLHMNTFEYASGTVATMRKSAKGATQPRKKVYEQALMVRKVKTYLAELKVIDKESDLDALSVELEPPTTSSSNGDKTVGSGGPPPRRPISNRVPSPTPSSLSSHSNASGPPPHPPSSSGGTGRGGFVGAKFGVESPQAVQKMLSLVQQSKMKERAPPSPHTGHHTLGRSSGLGGPPPPIDGRILHPSGLPTRGVIRVSSRNGVRDGFYPPSSPSSLSSHSTSSSSHHPHHPPPPLPSSLPPNGIDLNAESSSVTGYYHTDIPPLHAMLPAVPHNGPHSSTLYRSLFVSPSPSASISSRSSSSSHRPSLPSHSPFPPSFPSSQSVGVLMGHRVVPLLGRKRQERIGGEGGRGVRAASVDDPDHQVSRV